MPMQAIITHIYYQPIFCATMPEIRAPRMEPMGTIIEDSDIAIGNLPCCTSMKFTGIYEGTISPMPTAASARSTSTMGKLFAHCGIIKRKLKSALITIPLSMILVEPNFSDNLPVTVINTIVTIVSMFNTHEASCESICRACVIAYILVLTWIALIDWIKIGMAVTIESFRGCVACGLNLTREQPISFIWDARCVMGNRQC